MAKKTKAPEVTKGPTLAVLTSTYPHIQSIAAIGDSGRITRIVINCTGTQDGSHDDDCSTTREIATQDAFQVQRSIQCQRMFARIRRRKTPLDAGLTKTKTHKRQTTKRKRTSAPKRKRQAKVAA